MRSPIWIVCTPQRTTTLRGDVPTWRPSTMIFRPGGSGLVSRIPVFEGSALKIGATPPAPPLAGFFATDALGGGSAAAVGGGGGSGAGAGGG